MYFFLLFNDWNYVWFDESLALMDRLKKAIAKIRKKKHCLHLHNTCCVFAFYVTLKNDSLLYVFYSTLLAFGMGRLRTPAKSKMEHFVTKVNSWKSLLLL